MSHQDTQFVHERAKASLDSKILDKMNRNIANFLTQLEADQVIPEEPFHIYIQQYVPEPPAPNPLYHPLPSEKLPFEVPAGYNNNNSSTALLSNASKLAAQAGPKNLLTMDYSPLSPATEVTKVYCSPHVTIGELKRLYYTERIKARKRKAKEIFYRRVELEMGAAKVAAIKAQEERERLELKDAWVDPLETVLPEEYEQCCYEWGFLDMEEYDIAEMKREENAAKGKFVPKRAALTNFQYAGQYLKDYHKLSEYAIPKGAHINHTLRFPDIHEVLSDQLTVVKNLPVTAALAQPYPQDAQNSLDDASASAGVAGVDRRGSASSASGGVTSQPV